MSHLTTKIAVLLALAGAAPASLPDAAAVGASFDATDPADTLKSRLETGAANLRFQPDGLGYLPDLLAQLDIDPESQILVFSKTSLQHEFISAATPRAIYFNDSVAVGFVQNAPVLEIISTTAERGFTFYTVDNVAGNTPAFARQEGHLCGKCHGVANTLEPGMLVASTPVAPDGMPVFLPVRTYTTLFNITDERAPIAERWSGWYVTGTHGSQTHQGNGALLYHEDGTPLPARAGTQNIKTLDAFFDTGKYLKPGSDIVALMTYEHQSRITAVLLAAGAAARRENGLSGQLVDEVVDRLLFVGEAPLTSPVQGTSDFASHFSQRGPRDSHGRSLRDFDLKTRLFRYPLSYMIYSPSFAAIPADGRAQIYRRLLAILSGKDPSPRYAHMNVDDKKEVLAILRDTKSDLPRNW